MISAVVLTHQDALKIRQTLEHLRWCDEIIVIDDVSTDGTIEIVQKFTHKLYKRPLEGDFAAQRNFALRKAKGEWVLFVDSDEIVDPQLQKEIQIIIKSSTVQGIYLRRMDTVLGKELHYGETAHVKLLRAGRRTAGIWKRAVHEYWDIQGETITTQAPLRHESHDTVSEFIEDVNWYSTLNAEVFYREGVRSNWLQIMLFPLGKFIRNYILLSGFRDGTVGMIVSIMMSLHSFLTRSKLFLRQSKS